MSVVKEDSGQLVTSPCDFEVGLFSGVVDPFEKWRVRPMQILSVHEMPKLGNFDNSCLL